MYNINTYFISGYYKLNIKIFSIMQKEEARKLPHRKFGIIGRAVYPASQVPFRVCREPFPTSIIPIVYFCFFLRPSIISISRISNKVCSLIYLLLSSAKNVSGYVEPSFLPIVKFAYPLLKCL